MTCPGGEVCAHPGSRFLAGGSLLHVPHLGPLGSAQTRPRKVEHSRGRPRAPGTPLPPQRHWQRAPRSQAAAGRPRPHRSAQCAGASPWLRAAGAGGGGGSGFGLGRRLRRRRQRKGWNLREKVVGRFHRPEREGLAGRSLGGKARLVVNRNIGVLRAVGTIHAEDPCSLGRRLKFPGPGARRLLGRRRDRCPGRRRPRGSCDMQSTDLGSKESGKIWHRKPSPATRDGYRPRREEARAGGGWRLARGGSAVSGRRLRVRWGRSREGGAGNRTEVLVLTLLVIPGLGDL